MTPCPKCDACLTADRVEAAAIVEAPDIPGFWDAILTCFKKCFNWKGRASRSEYLYFQILVLLNFAVFVISMWLRRNSEAPVLAFFFYLSCVVGIAAWFANFAVTARRFHDFNRGAWGSWVRTLLVIFPCIIAGCIYASFFIVDEDKSFPQFFNMLLPFRPDWQLSVIFSPGMYERLFTLFRLKEICALTNAYASFTFWLCCIFYFVVVPCVKPTPGPNRYGPQPRKRRRQEDKNGVPVVER